MEQTDETGTLGHMKMKTFFCGCYLTVAHTRPMRRISRTSNRSTGREDSPMTQKSGIIPVGTTTAHDNRVAEPVPAWHCAAEGRAVVVAVVESSVEPTMCPLLM